jgi:MFS family permease
MTPCHMSFMPTHALRRMAGAATLPSVGRRLAPVVVAYAFTVAMLSTTVPTPLYDLYRHHFGFSELMVTVIFATYAAGVIVALVLFGHLSDELGRRSVLLAGLVLAAAAMAAFLAAQDLTLLLVGRFVSGLSAGILAGTATAAIIDLTPAERPGRGTLISTLAQMGGLGLGPLVAGAIASSVAAPLRVPFWVTLGLLIPAFVGVWAMPERGRPAGRRGLRPRLVTVPAPVRATFVPAAMAAFAGFAVLGLFTALAPGIMAEELALTSPAVVGVVVFAVFIAATAGELAQGRVSSRAGLVAGCLTLIAGVGFLALSLADASLALLVIGGVIAGLGLGLGFRAGLTGVTAASPPDQRAGVASAFFVVAYIALALPVVGVGVVAQIAGLRTAGLLFTAVVAAIAAAAVGLIEAGARTDPRTA